MPPPPADERNNVQGVITRKDLTHDYGHLLLHEKDHIHFGEGHEPSDDDEEADEGGTYLARSRYPFEDSEREATREYYDEDEYAELRRSSPRSLHSLGRASDREGSLPENLRQL